MPGWFNHYKPVCVTLTWSPPLQVFPLILYRLSPSPNLDWKTLRFLSPQNCDTNMESTFLVYRFQYLPFHYQKL